MSDLESSQTAEQSKLVCWSKLSPDEQAFVTAYVENGYSIAKACTALEITDGQGRRLLAKPDVKNAVTELQHTLGDIEFLNEVWVKTQLLRLYPMVMGEEAVPMIDAAGNQYSACKFNPEVAMRILEYVAPKEIRVKSAQQLSLSVNVNIDLAALGIVRGETYDNE